MTRDYCSPAGQNDTGLGITGTCLKNPGPPDHDTFGAKARDHGSLKAHALKVVWRSLGKQLGDLITLAREFRGKHDVVSSCMEKTLV